MAEQLYVTALETLFPDATCPAFVVQRGGRSGTTPYVIIGVEPGVVLSVYPDPVWGRLYEIDPQGARASFLQDARHGMVLLYRGVTVDGVRSSLTGFADGFLGDFSTIEEGTVLAVQCLAQLPAALAERLASDTVPSTPTGYKPLRYRIGITLLRHLVTGAFLMSIAYLFMMLLYEKTRGFVVALVKGIPSLTTTTTTTTTKTDRKKSYPMKECI